MTFIVFSVLVWKVIDFLRMLFNITAQKSAIITQATAWIGGVVLVILAAHAQVAGGLILPGADEPLRTLDFGSQVLLGLLVASFASATVDVKQAIDRSDSAVKPGLLDASVTASKTSTP
jgi:hypothetical protein